MNDQEPKQDHAEAMRIAQLDNRAPTRPEWDPYEAITLKAIPLPRIICWDAVIASDDFYEEPTVTAPEGSLRWASFARIPTGSGRRP